MLKPRKSNKLSVRLELRALVWAPNPGVLMHPLHTLYNSGIWGSVVRIANGGCLQVGKVLVLPNIVAPASAFFSVLKTGSCNQTILTPAESYIESQKPEP